MAPKGGNAKKESGRAKKAENEVSVGCERGEIAKVTPPCGDWEFTDVGYALAMALVCNRKRKRLQLKRSRRPRKLMSGSLAVRFPFFLSL